MVSSPLACAYNGILAVKLGLQRAFAHSGASTVPAVSIFRAQFGDLVTKASCQVASTVVLERAHTAGGIDVAARTPLP